MKVWPASMVLIWAAACSGEGFESVMTDEARVIGRVVYSDGRPAADFPVYSVIGGRSERSVTTDADGAFVFEDAPAGPMVLVAHDGAGNGGQRALTVYAGENDAGAITVALLRLEPEVLGFRGIGFEERISALAPFAELVAIAPDGAPIVLGYELEPVLDGRGRLLRIDVETGAAEELIPGLEVAFAAALDDRILIADRVERSGTIAIDLATRTVFYASQAEENVVNSGETSIYRIEDGIFAVEYRDHQYIPVKAGFNLSREEGPAFIGAPSLISSTADHFYFMAPGNGVKEIGSIDRRTWELDSIAVIGDVDFRGSAVRDHLFYYVTSEDEAMRTGMIDLHNGRRSLLHSESCAVGEPCLGSIAADREREEMVILGGPDRGVVRVEAAGEVRSTAIDFDPASGAARCFHPQTLGICRMAALHGDHLRLTAQYIEASNTVRMMIADVIGDRVTRVIDEPAERTGWSFAVVPISDERELVMKRDDDGHRQLWLGPSGRELSMFRTVSFLIGDRRAPLISLDRRHAYYVLEDPVRTVPSLFRVELPER